MPDLLAGSDRVQRAHDHLPGASAMGVFCQAVFEQLCVSQDDPELVVQEVEEFCQVTVSDSGLRIQSGHDDEFRLSDADPGPRETPRGVCWRRAKGCR